ncbi:LutB/LldF family L-lactate oxidation iron-sulfur protein [Campylobacter geochelonis]|uniref:Iron-sulfur cluster binding protein n=1 Tax=Campylobacter geochelonis TaxID=1780362 RepID=A0A128EK35_9BACT|nr:LutB/LldF family L-lactate oxidation iron-sulfur protein [Campylobacter geochelonis]QKF71649.1 NAD-independent L-lactate dehydrogenase LldEFG, iron-sulfur cluster subunit [Campylobacter geochelonis]CZE49270.1 iron-sulfur cluster binding protein [Campylobacter geochelonis]CZE51479.1 iron-sulfur cluster binding protein [Campylobacter geochelonis]
MKHEEIVRENLANKQLRENLSKAMHTLQTNRAKMVESKFVNWEELREQSKYAKNKALNSLEERLLEFEANATKNGFIVHWANDGDEACEIIYNIMLEKKANKILKGKSMASEEIGLNHYLEKRGITAMETDLGEVIIQLIHEAPVHIVVPAIHKNRYEIGEIFHDKLGVEKESEPEKLNAIAREYLRGEFKELSIGLGGVNFALSKEGAIWMIENEGNGRMCTTISDVLISVCGIEKVLETVEDAVSVDSMLTPSATGQFIANYNNIISGPRREGELDGPKECHIVLFDNRRTDMLRHEDYHEVLRCIRCGTCMNFCPVYDKIGGHSYQATYPGPIGDVIDPQIFGMDEHGDVVTLCSLCNRCSAVCPVKIPLADMIRKLRRDKVGDGDNPPFGTQNLSKNIAEKMVFKAVTTAFTNGWIFRNGVKAARMFNTPIHMVSGFVPVVNKWTKYKNLSNFGIDVYKEVSNMQGVRYE